MLSIICLLVLVYYFVLFINLKRDFKDLEQTVNGNSFDIENILYNSKQKTAKKSLTKKPK